MSVANCVSNKCYYLKSSMLLVRCKFNVNKYGSVSLTMQMQNMVWHSSKIITKKKNSFPYKGIYCSCGEINLLNKKN